MDAPAASPHHDDYVDDLLGDSDGQNDDAAATESGQNGSLRHSHEHDTGGLTDSDNDEAPTLDSYDDIPPHREQQFASYEAMERYVWSFAQKHGFEPKRQGTKVNGAKERRMVSFRCGKYTTKKLSALRDSKDNTKRPEAKSKRTGCPYSINCYADDSEHVKGSWTLYLGSNPRHSHGKRDAISLANLRRRNRTKELSEFML